MTIPPQTGPPTISFPASDLERYVNTTEYGKPRKPPIDLEKCPLFEMKQYRCVIVKSEAPKERKMVSMGKDQRSSVEEKKPEREDIVSCTPFQRLFRKCAEGLMVETTEWEYLKET